MPAHLFRKLCSVDHNSLCLAKELLRRFSVTAFHIKETSDAVSGASGNIRQWLQSIYEAVFAKKMAEGFIIPRFRRNILLFGYKAGEAPAPIPKHICTADNKRRRTAK